MNERKILLRGETDLVQFELSTGHNGMLSMTLFYKKTGEEITLAENDRVLAIASLGPIVGILDKKGEEYQNFLEWRKNSKTGE